MNEQTLSRQRDRTHAIVEGALLGDIAIVFLMIRAFLPVLPARTILKAIAALPLVMLTQRRGVKLTILAGIASYILFSAFVGPILGLAAIDVAVAGILVGVGRKAGLPGWLNTLWTGAVYAVLDLALPTVAAVIIFRYPVNKLVDAAHNFIHLLFNVWTGSLELLHFPKSAVTTVHGWEAPTAQHWQLVWLGATVLSGILTMFLVVLVTQIVMNQLPEETLARRRAA
jgi:hypothetical protein